MHIETIECDYVVVGSGSAGSVIAARLTENPNTQVVVLEAGPPDDNKWIKVPLGFAKVLANPKYMWHLESDPEPYLFNRRISAIRGKVVGGSSAVNGMVYVRGVPSDYAIWRQLGASGWAYDDVLPYFRKAERHQHGSDGPQGADGPLSVEDARWNNPLADAFLASAGALGLPRVRDFRTMARCGVGYYQLTTQKGQRMSAAEAYLKPALGRTNLRLFTEALVLKIEFDGREATSVLFEQGGRFIRVRARREIVLSAGSFSTPQLLQLSGVGAGSLVAEYGIPLVHELRGVGENLIDHFLIKRGYTTDSPYTVNALMRNPIAQGWAGLRYLMNRAGPLAVGAALAGGYAMTRPELEDPDIQFYFLPFESHNFSAELAPESSFHLSFYQNRPESRGYVRIRSANPREAPHIVPNYISTPSDIRTAIDGLKFIGRIGAGTALKALGAKEKEPSASLASDDALLDYIRGTASSSYHHVGTCRMGQDEMAVVDPQLRVRGVSKLRIADGSVLPALTSGNTNSVCIMIGEKCADLLAKAA